MHLRGLEAPWNAVKFRISLVKFRADDVALLVAMSIPSIDPNDGDYAVIFWNGRLFDVPVSSLTALDD